MPYKDSQKQREKQADYMRRRRAEKKSQEMSPPGKIESGASSSPELINPNPEANQDSRQPAAVTTKSPPSPQQVPIVGATSAHQIGLEDYAHYVSERTLYELNYGKGWITWYIPKIADTRIVIIRDVQVTEFPEGLPVFTLAEIKQMGQMDVAAIRLCLEVKKLDLEAKGERK